MENASKALIMAGGILIGVIILTIFSYEMIFVGDISNNYERILAKSQAEEFNSQFEIFVSNEKKATAQEIATLYNFIYEWNYGESGHPNDIVKMEFKGTELSNFFRGSEPDKELRTDPDIIEKFLMKYSDKKYYFRCTDIKYKAGDYSTVTSIAFELKTDA